MTWPMSFADWRACDDCGNHVVWGDHEWIDEPDRFAVIHAACPIYESTKGTS